MRSLGESGRRDLGPTARVALDVAGRGAGALLAAVSAARGGKAVHPCGAVHRARLAIDGAPHAPQASDLLSRPGEWTVVVRFSRSLGLPRPLPDLLGVSLRVLDAYGEGRHQDVLLVSSVDRPILHHVFVPAGDVQQRPYTCALPYRAGDDRFLIGLMPDPSSPRLSGTDELDRLAKAASTGRLRFDVAVARVNGRFRPVGTLHVGERMSPEVDALRFNPFNCGGGLEPTGVLNRLRDYAYPLSQAAWGRDEHRARAQETADAEVRRLAAA